MIGFLQQAQTKFVIRPFEVKHLFDLAIKLYRSNFVVLFLCQAMVQLPLALLVLGPTLRMIDFSNKLSVQAQTGEDPAAALFTDDFGMLMWMAGAFFAAMAYQLLITPIGNVACAYAAKESLLGRLVGFGEAVRFALTRYWQTQVALATFFLPLLAVAVLMLLPVLLLQGLGDDSMLIGMSVLGLMLILAAGSLTFLMWFRCFPSLMGIIQSAEDPPPGGVFNQGLYYLRRSFELSRGFFGRVFGLSLLVFLAIYIIDRGIAESIQLLMLLAKSLASGQNPGQELMNMAMGPGDPVLTGITMAVASLVGLIFPPFLMSFLTLLYYDLRCRKEAFDLKRELGLLQP